MNFITALASIGSVKQLVEDQHVQTSYTAMRNHVTGSFAQMMQSSIAQQENLSPPVRTPKRSIK